MGTVLERNQVMVKVRIKRETGTAESTWTVTAESIERALELCPGEIQFPLENDFFEQGDDKVE